MKQIHFRKAEGKTLKLVYDCDRGWQRRKTKTKVPDSSHLFNFDVHADDKHYLVLDPYGDEVMTQRMRNRLWQTKGKTPAFAIDRDTGEVGHAAFYFEHGYTMSFWRLPDLVVPKKFLPRLDELKSMKRPVRLGLDEGALMLFIEREAHLDDLRKAVTVTLHLNGKKGQSLQLWGQLWRLVSNWDSETL